jgi:hypothetical protein
MTHLFAGLVVSTFVLAHPFPALAQGADPDSSQTWSEVDSTAKETTPQETPPDVVTTPPARQTEVLPFAKNELPRESFAVGMGAGVATYVVDLKEVDRAFRAMEDEHRNNGYSIPSGRGSPLGPMALWTVTMHFEKAVDVALQLGRSDGEDTRLRTTGLLVSRRIASAANGDILLVAGLGGGTYGFSFTRHYGATISPVDGSGGYTTLDAIVLEGGGNYWTGRGGLTLRPGQHLSVDLLTQYVGMNDASGAQGAGRTTINLSGFMFGGSITLFL